MREDFPALRELPREEGDEPVVIERVFSEDMSPEEVAARVRAVVPDAELEVETAFGGPEDRFHFLSFPTIRSRGRVAGVFAFARALRPEVGAPDTNTRITGS